MTRLLLCRLPRCWLSLSVPQRTIPLIFDVITTQLTPCSPIMKTFKILPKLSIFSLVIGNFALKFCFLKNNFQLSPLFFNFFSRNICCSHFWIFHSFATLIELFLGFPHLYIWIHFSLVGSFIYCSFIFLIVLLFNGLRKIIL